MIQETLLRLKGLVPVERTFIVTHESHVKPIRKCLRGGGRPQIIPEPYARDTAACIGLAAVHVRHADPDAVMLVFPADQVIHPVRRFQQVMRAGVELARQGDVLVTFGIKPSYAATGYGYIHRGARVGEARGIPVYAAQRFREKPKPPKAEEFFATGEYYWNSGIFCWRAATILDCLRRHAPELHAALERIAAAMDTPDEASVLREAYEPLRKISIDYAVMEKAEAIRVVEADFDWSDVGSWESVWRLRHAKGREQGNVLVGPCEVLDAANSLVMTEEGHLVGLVGLKDVVVVHTPKATLVCSKRRAEDVKLLVDRLEKKGLTDYL
jgi:mannose-1-phosphate guanylyltransferase